MIGMEQLDRLRGAHVVDTDGHRVGTVADTYFTEDGPPTWVAVHTGFFDSRYTFVPLEDAELEGHVLRIPYSKHTVKEAPHLDLGAGPSGEEELDLHRYYDMSVPENRLRRHHA